MVIKYKIYDRNEVLELIQEKNKQELSGIRVVELDLPNHLEGLICHEKKPFPSADVQRIEFYAFSKGWDKLTTTGYRSHFFFGEDHYKKSELIANFYDFCMSHGMDVFHPQMPEPEQISIFI